MSWPIKCPRCNSFDFLYKSDTTGNVRLYTCHSCKGKWVATIRELPSSSASNEPKNLDSKHFHWVRVKQ